MQPAGWLDGKDTAGDHGGVADPETSGRVDRITGAVLDYGDHGLNYNFGELLPGSIRGTVQAHDGGECDFDNPQLLLEGVQIDLLDATGKLIATTQTDANGAYAFTNLAPGTYKVLEHQPTPYFNDDERVGTAGGESGEIGNEFSFITGIHLGSGVDAIHYDFCEEIGPSISGWVYHDRSDDGNRDHPAKRASAASRFNCSTPAAQWWPRRRLLPPQVRWATTNSRISRRAPMAFTKSSRRLGSTARTRPGDHGGAAASEAAGIVDNITGAVLVFGDHAINYNFGELLPGSIAGQVQAHGAGECDFDDPEKVLSGVTIQLLDSQATFFASRRRMPTAVTISIICVPANTRSTKCSRPVTSATTLAWVRSAATPTMPTTSRTSICRRVSTRSTTTSASRRLVRSPARCKPTPRASAISTIRSSCSRA